MIAQSIIHTTVAATGLTCMSFISHCKFEFHHLDHAFRGLSVIQMFFKCCFFKPLHISLITSIWIMAVTVPLLRYCSALSTPFPVNLSKYLGAAVPQIMPHLMISSRYSYIHTAPSQACGSLSFTPKRKF